MRPRIARLYCTAASSVQKRPISVSAAVRTVLFRAPKSFVRLKSLAHRSLVNAGGGGTSSRNWSALTSAKGLNSLSHTPTGRGGVLGGGAGYVGTGSQIPGP